jgi:hypothetical protein
MGLIGSAPGAAKEPAGREGTAGGMPEPMPTALGTVLLPLGTGERLNEDAAKPLAEMRCRLDEALRAGESGRYRARAVRMKVYERSAGYRRRRKKCECDTTHIWVLVVDTPQGAGVQQQLRGVSFTAGISSRG